jgi:hypothetical protein
MDKPGERVDTETEATLLSASPEQYMSAGQLAFFRRRLLAEEQAPSLGSKDDRRPPAGE